MKPQRMIISRKRLKAAALALVGLVAVGTAVSYSVVGEPESPQQVQVATAERPSFLSHLPELTEHALQSGAISPPVASTPAEQAAPVRQQLATLWVSTPQAEPEEAPEESPDIQRLRVTTNGLNVRSGPSSDSGKLFVLKQDEAVQVAEMNGSWARVTTASGETGWAYQRYLGPAE
ncbi:MAG: SH3 domain-containing protein [Actinomycetota bacterium]